MAEEVKRITTQIWSKGMEGKSIAGKRKWGRPWAEPKGGAYGD